MKHRLRTTRWISLAVCVSTPHLLSTSKGQWVAALICVGFAGAVDFLSLRGD